MNAEEFFNSIRVFGDPKVPDDLDLDGYIALYIRGLSRYSGEVLSSALQKMHDTRKHRNFPLLAECVEACREVKNEFAEQREIEKSWDQSSSWRKDDPWKDARIRAADRMMNSEIGRLAASEGWIVHLHDFCRENSGLPNHLESEKVRRQGLAIKAKREEMALAGGATNRIVRAVGSAMEKKRARLAALANGRDAG